MRRRETERQAEASLIRPIDPILMDGRISAEEASESDVLLRTKGCLKSTLSPSRRPQEPQLSGCSTWICKTSYEST